MSLFNRLTQEFNYLGGCTWSLLYYLLFYWSPETVKFNVNFQVSVGRKDKLKGFSVSLPRLIRHLTILFLSNSFQDPLMIDISVPWIILWASFTNLLFPSLMNKRIKIIEACLLYLYDSHTFNFRNYNSLGSSTHLPLRENYTKSPEKNTWPHILPWNAE